MAYGHKAGDCRVYEYGCGHSPIRRGLGQNLELAKQEMRRRVGLWNRLVELDQQERAAKEAIMGPAPVGSDGKRQRRTLTDEQKAELQAIQDATRVRVNELCQESGCYWMNYSEVKQAWDMARKKPGGQLRFHSAARERGKVTTFLVRGLPVPEAFSGQSAYLHIALSPTNPKHADLRMRIASDENRQPVWLSLPITYNRPLPADCYIKNVSAYCERISTDERWTVSFVLERREGSWAKYPDATRAGTVALDLGWRRLPGEGIRVAVWRDQAGQTGELRLPERYVEQRARVERIQSHRQNLFNETVTALLAWVEARESPPEWLTEAIKYARQWRRYGHLVTLLRDWHERRFRGDEPIVAMLEAWQQRDLHLWRYGDHLRDQVLQWRRETYREMAAQLARRYSTVILEEFDLRQVARLKSADGKPNELVKRARYYRQIAGLSELRLALESTCEREGGTVARRPAAYTTMQCPVCGSIEDWDHRELRHTCSECGCNWDQDYSAAENLLVGAAAG